MTSMYGKSSRCFPSYSPLKEELSSRKIPKNFHIIHNAILFVCNEISDHPWKYPFNKNDSQCDIFHKISSSILNRLLFTNDNSQTVNYLFSCIEHLILHASNDSNGYGNEHKNENEIEIEMEANDMPDVNICHVLLNEWLVVCKQCKMHKYFSVHSCHTLLMIILITFDLMLAMNKNNVQCIEKFEAIDKVLERMALLLNSRTSNHSLNMLRKFLVRNEFLIPPMMKLCIANSNKYYGMIAILIEILVAEYRSKLVAKTFSKYNKILHDFILNSIIGSKQPPDMRVRNAFCKYFQSFDDHSSLNVLLAEILRMLKRKPLETMKTFELILDNLNAKNCFSFRNEDLRNFLPIILNEIRNFDKNEQKCNQNVFRLFTKLCVNDDHHKNIINILNMIHAHLMGRHGSISIKEERIEILHCYQYLLQNIKSNSSIDYHDMCAVFVKNACEFMNKESHEHVRSICILYISQWLDTCQLNDDIFMNITQLIFSNIGSNKIHCLKSFPAIVYLLIYLLDNNQSSNELIDKTLAINGNVLKILQINIEQALLSPKKEMKLGLASFLLLLYLCENNTKLLKTQLKTFSSVICMMDDMKCNNFLSNREFIWNKDTNEECLHVSNNSFRLKILHKLFHSSFYMQKSGLLNGEISNNNKGMVYCLFWMSLSNQYRYRFKACQILRYFCNNVSGIKFKNKHRNSPSQLMANLLIKFLHELMFDMANAHELIPYPINLQQCLKSIAGDSPAHDCIVNVLYLAHFPWISNTCHNETHRLRMRDSEHVPLRKMKKKRMVNDVCSQIMKQWQINDENEESLHKILCKTLNNNSQLEDLTRTYLTSVKFEIAQIAICECLAFIFSLSPDLIVKNERILHIIDHVFHACNDILDYSPREIAICKTGEGILYIGEDEQMRKNRDAKKNKKKQPSKKKVQSKSKSKAKIKSSAKSSKFKVSSNKNARIKQQNRGKKDNIDENEQKKDIASEDESILTEDELNAKLKLEMEMRKKGYAEGLHKQKVEQQAWIRRKWQNIQRRLYCIFNLFQCLIFDCNPSLFADNMCQK